MKLDVSTKTALDYRDKMRHLCSNPMATVEQCITSPNEAFLLGTYMDSWESMMVFPYQLSIHVRHAEDRVQKIAGEIKYFGDKYTSMLPQGAQVDYLEYCQYLLDNILTEDESLREDLCFYLGQQYGKALGLEFGKNLTNSVVFVKTESGTAFIGIIKEIHPGTVLLLRAHELIGDTRSLSELTKSCAAEPVIPYLLLYDVAEVRPCNIDTLTAFIDRTGCLTYGDPRQIG